MAGGNIPPLTECTDRSDDSAVRLNFPDNLAGAVCNVCEFP